MATNWTEQASQMFKFWSEGQKAWLESLARPPVGVAPPFAQGALGQDAARQMNDAWKVSIEQWMALVQQGTQLAFSQDNLRKIVDPAEWAKPVPGSFDFGIERLIEGPTFATLWDLDRKMLTLQQLGMKRTEDSAAYHAIMFAAWNRVAERFARQLSSGEAGPVGSFRELTDRWDQDRQRNAAGGPPVTGIPRGATAGDAQRHRLPPRRARDRGGLLRNASSADAHRDGRSPTHGLSAAPRPARVAAEARKRG